MATVTLKKIEKEIKEQEEVLCKTNLKALEYIKFMASRTNIDITKWNIWDDFNEPDADKTLLSNKREIGKVFLAKLEEIQEKEKDKKNSSSISDIPDLVEKLKERVNNSLKSRILNINRDSEAHKNRAYSYQSNLCNELESLNKLGIELSILQGNDPSNLIVEELDEVLKQDYWINPIFDGQYLYLNTKNHAVIIHKNKAASVDISVDCGQLAVKVDISNFRMWVIPYKNNIAAKQGNARYYHPHIEPNGGICWGDASENIYEWTKTLKLASLLKLLYSLLMNYCDNYPYINIVDMKRLSRGYGRCSDFLRHPDKGKKKKIEADVPMVETVPSLGTGETVSAIFDNPALPDSYSTNFTTPYRTSMDPPIEVLIVSDDEDIDPGS